VVQQTQSQPAPGGDLPAGSLPLVEEVLPMPDSQAAFLCLASLPHCLFLDSAMKHPELGRYSFLAADPYDVLQCQAGQDDALEQLQQKLDQLAAATPLEHRHDLPPFQGGVAGLFGYGLASSLEKIPPPRADEFQVPALAVGFYDVVLALDHFENRAWIISQGLPETEPGRRAGRARQRADQFRQWLNRPPLPHAADKADPLPAESLVRQYPVGNLAGLTSNFSAAGYHRAVQQVVDYIHAGDVFQVNLSQRLLYPAHDDSISLYLRLRERNPATFAGYFAFGRFQLVSASPERFLRVEKRRVEARPIKGTRARMLYPEADLMLAEELRRSEKDRSENIMIVDLLRNDLSVVCEADSVHVSKLCELEAYQYVQHLVSVVEGRLREGQGLLDLLRASFPGGSITGAPKVRAMEIIAELEPTSRGPYCGSLGYLSVGGSMDLNILIRTITAGRGWWQFPVGGGIVAQSNPEREYTETWEKAAGILHSLE
jgi:para-aminobenzoate synthetase component 1